MTDRHPIWCLCLDCERKRLEIEKLKHAMTKRPETHRYYLLSFPWWMPLWLARHLPARVRPVLRVDVRVITIEHHYE